jgi:hypothetical protein
MTHTHQHSYKALQQLLVYTATEVKEKLRPRRTPDGRLPPPLSNGNHPGNGVESSFEEPTMDQFWGNSEQETLTNGHSEPVDNRDDYVHSPES